jgi:predicted RNA-binding Zn ribbon-like protein
MDLPLPLPPDLVGSRPAPGSLALVQAFTNSADLEAGVDRMGDRVGFVGWMTAVGLAASTTPFTDEDRRAAIELREGIRALVRDRDRDDANDGSGADGSPMLSLEESIDHLALTVTYRGGAFRTTSATVLGQALGPVIEALRAGMSNGTWLRLKVCARDRCQWLFYDNSRNQGSHWCTTDVCGSREKARRAYARSTGKSA